MKKTPFQRFQAQCGRDENGCVRWTGQKSKFGYGRFAFGGPRYVPAHRWLWERLNGPVPEGLILMHTCDVRDCVNLAHLRLGTHQLNMLDMKQKGRSAKGARHHKAKLTEKQAKQVIALIAKGTARQRIAERFGITVFNVTCIAQGKGWAHLPRPDMSNRRRGNGKLTGEQVAEIRALLAAGNTGAALARRFNVSDGAISMIKNRLTYR